MSRFFIWAFSAFWESITKDENRSLKVSEAIYFEKNGDIKYGDLSNIRFLLVMQNHIVQSAKAAPNPFERALYNQKF